MGKFAAVLILICIGAAAIGATTAPATSPSTAPATSTKPAVKIDPAMREKVAKLVKQLGADDFSAREAAKKNLIALKIAALPAMREFVGKSKVDEVEAGLTGAIEAVIENNVLLPDNISVDFAKAQSWEVAETLSKLTGGKIEFDESARDDKTQLTLKMEDKPFMEVIAAIKNKSPLELYPGRTQGNLRLTNLGRKSGYGPLNISGPFLFYMSAVYHDQRLEFVTGEKEEHFGIGIRCMADPRTPVLTMQPPAFKEIKDDAGNAIQLAEPAGRKNANRPPAMGQFGEFAVELVYPKNAGKKFARIAGEVTVCVCLETRSLDVANIETMPISLVELDGYVAGVSDVKVVGNELRFAWTSRTPPKKEGAPDGPPARFKIFDANSRHVATGYVGTNNIWIDRERPPVPPFRGVLEIPAAYKTFAVPFEFKDLPMP